MDLIPHVVEQGDFLQKLAWRYGFDADAVWQLPENKPLRDLGRDPNILHPRDILYIPKPKPKWKPLSLGTKNSFVSPVAIAPITLTFASMAGTPLADAECTFDGLELPAEELPKATDAKGSLKLKLRVHQPPFVVEFPKLKVKYTVHLGHLDPVAEESGVKQRLTQIGYGPGPVHRLALAAGHARPLSDAYHRERVAAFQTDQGIAVTGDVCDATRGALTAAHRS